MIPAREYWQTRDKTFGDGWMSRYWESWQAPHRRALAAEIDRLGRVASILEIGCHCGPNLRLWRSLWPTTVLLGMDLNGAAVAYGTTCFEQDPLTHLVVDDYRAVDVFPEVDVVVSCYAMCYTPPAEIGDMLERCWKAASRAVILAEPMCVAGEVEGPCAEIEEWRYDYEAKFRALGASTVEVRVIPLADRLNGIVIARKA